MNKKKAANYIQDLGALIALVLLIVVIGAISPEFRTVGNFLSLLRQSSINGLIAFGMTCVILTGGIDLSVGSVLALTTAMCAGFISGGMPVGLAMILALGDRNRIWMYQWISCNKRQITALYCNVDHNDRVPGTDDDLYGWKTDLQLGRQLYTESSRKRKLLSHSDSGHLVYTDFCNIFICIAENNFRTSYLCNRKQCKSQPIWQDQY